MSSGSLNASLDTGKPCTEVSGRTRTVCTRCLPAPIYMHLPGLEGISLLPGKGGYCALLQGPGELISKNRSSSFLPARTILPCTQHITRYGRFIQRLPKREEKEENCWWQSPPFVCLSILRYEVFNPDIFERLNELLTCALVG